MQTVYEKCEPVCCTSDNIAIPFQKKHRSSCIQHNVTTRHVFPSPFSPPTFPCATLFQLFLFTQQQAAFPPFLYAMPWHGNYEFFLLNTQPEKIYVAIILMVVVWFGSNILKVLCLCTHTDCVPTCWSSLKNPHDHDHPKNYFFRHFLSCLLLLQRNFHFTDITAVSS